MISSAAKNIKQQFGQSRESESQQKQESRMTVIEKYISLSKERKVFSEISKFRVFSSMSPSEDSLRMSEVLFAPLICVNNDQFGVLKDGE